MKLFACLSLQNAILEKAMAEPGSFLATLCLNGEILTSLVIRPLSSVVH